jgi:hypothetical protein
MWLPAAGDGSLLGLMVAFGVLGLGLVSAGTEIARKVDPTTATTKGWSTRARRRRLAMPPPRFRASGPALPRNHHLRAPPHRGLSAGYVARRWWLSRCGLACHVMRPPKSRFACHDVDGLGVAERSGRPRNRPRLQD